MSSSKLTSFKDAFSYQVAQFINEVKDLIVVARVTNVILDQNLESKLGYVVCNLITPNGLTLKKDIQAKPLQANFKKYPLRNELVYLLKLPGTSLNQTSTGTQYYYIDTISIWNHPHHNAFPENPNQLPPEQQKDYLMTVAGSPRRLSKGNPSDINLGTTFVERPSIHPLLPFEGDVLVEGRWGNSIRFGSTVRNLETSQSIFPQGSNTGTPGDPITIIRNGQNTQASDQGWTLITEDINNDPSSIYLTTSQTLPLIAGTNVATTYVSSSTKEFTRTNVYNGPQVILNSSRIVLNANQKDGTILLSGANTIALQANSSINLFAKTDIVLDGKVRLGGSTASEPLLKGNATIDVLTRLVANMEEFVKVCKRATYQVYNDKTKTYEALPIGGGLGRAAEEFIPILENIKTNLPNLKSDRSYTL